MTAPYGTIHPITTKPLQDLTKDLIAGGPASQALGKVYEARGYDELVQAMAMIATGDTAAHWKALVDAFEARVKAQVLAISGGHAR